MTYQNFKIQIFTQYVTYRALALLVHTDYGNTRVTKSHIRK